MNIGVPRNEGDQQVSRDEALQQRRNQMKIPAKMPVKSYLLGLSAVFFVFQNFTLIESKNDKSLSGVIDSMTSALVGPVNEVNRKSHALELLGKDYSSSWVAQGRQIKSFSTQIYQEVARSLPKRHKKAALEITKTLIAESQKQGFDPLFVMAIIKTESMFNPTARGQHGEIGLMQLKPATAEWIAKRHGVAWYGPLTLESPKQNLKIGIAYLSFLRKKFSQNPEFYIAAYNSGSAKTRMLASINKIPQVYRTKVMGFYQASYKKLVLGSSPLFAVN